MSVGSWLPYHVVWQACVSFIWAKWMPQCLQGTLSRRTSCECKGVRGEPRGRSRAVGVPKRSARVFSNYIAEVYREVSCVGP